jgi:hypothetical protein
LPPSQRNVKRSKTAGKQMAAGILREPGLYTLG